MNDSRGAKDILHVYHKLTYSYMCNSDLPLASFLLMKNHGCLVFHGDSEKLPDKSDVSDPEIKFQFMAFGKIFPRFKMSSKKTFLNDIFLVI